MSRSPREVRAASNMLSRAGPKVEIDMVAVVATR